MRHMRVVAAFAAGVILGALLLFAGVEVVGGWYTYVTLSKSECESFRLTAEVVPHQPNPCHYRYRRWGAMP